jgi:hypothetical protein
LGVVLRGLEIGVNKDVNGVEGRQTISPKAGRIGIMPRLLTADDIMPLVASLTENERARLIRWIGSPGGADATAYAAKPPNRDEFQGDEEPAGWDGEGWEEFH